MRESEPDSQKPFKHLQIFIWNALKMIYKMEARIFDDLVV